MPTDWNWRQWHTMPDQSIASCRKQMLKDKHNRLLAQVKYSTQMRRQLSELQVKNQQLQVTATKARSRAFLAQSKLPMETQVPKEENSSFSWRKDWCQLHKFGSKLESFELQT
eukprot:TRINITY_DN4737_c0_g1_i1.p3 TRINITY_DN4737_c0_g1~~TRINITY_DN4737_c0_g1_i1.p3  ORF type:complete len:113 (-),score=20.00 TRINITY_DN4737_c0_g1_i1:203-541(-)